MTIKITIEKNSKSADALKAIMKQKEDFRKAVEAGKVDEYVKQRPTKFARIV